MGSAIKRVWKSAHFHGHASAILHSINCKIIMQETHTKSPMHRILGFAALIGFAGALVVHIAALTGVDVVDKFPTVWGLQIGIFFIFIPFVFSSRKTLDPKPTSVRIRAAFPMSIVDQASVFSCTC